MHQEHSIPWNLVASNLTFIRDNPRFTPRYTGLFLKGRPTQGRELNHFARVMARRITTFSETERAKYPAKLDVPADGKLFSDRLRDRFPQYLNEQNQYIEHWIAQARNSRVRRPDGREESYSFYSSEDASQFADVVKVLLNENHIAPLLVLAQHPKIPLHSLWNLSYGYYLLIGVDRVAHAALQAYIFCNLIAATNTLMTAEYKETARHGRFIVGDARSLPYQEMAAHSIPHVAFFGSVLENSNWWSNPVPNIHHDLDRLKEYLKTTFRLLYTYDLVSHECGMSKNIRWENEITDILGSFIRRVDQ